MAGNRFLDRKNLLKASGAAAALSVVLGLLTLALPGLLSRDFDQRSLASLKRQSVRVKKDFDALLVSLQARKARFSALPRPSASEGWFPLFRDSGLDPETEGLALSNGDGFLEVWFGNVLSLSDHIDKKDLEKMMRAPGAVLVRSRASVYLASVQSLGEGQPWLAHFRRLAFTPRFQSASIRESHTLRPAFRTAFDIDYWDFREDVAGFESFFARHDDEFKGQPRQENEIQTLFFPLRDGTGRIMATVTVSSPSLTSKLTGVREDLWLSVLLLLSLAGLLTLAFLWSSPHWLREGKALPGALIVLLTAGLRLASLPLGRLGKLQSLPMFSPASAGFLSLGGLTSSPADILLTALAVLSLAACLAVYGKRLFRVERLGPAGPASPALHVLAAAVGAGGLIVVLWVVRQVVFHSNISLLRWTFDPPFLALHLSLFVLLTALLVPAALAFRLAALHSRRRPLSGLFVVLGTAVLAVLAGPGLSPLQILLQTALLAWLFAVVSSPTLPKRREAWFTGLVLVALWMSQSVDDLTIRRTHRLLETTLRHTIIYQETWGNFLIEQSLPDLDRSRRFIVSFLKDPEDRDFAHSLWERSPVAKFNWYSSLEIRDPDGQTLSRFSLNVPKAVGGPPDLEPAVDWTIVPQTLTFIGKKKEFLVGYKDYHDGGRHLGRLVLYVALDPEMLPFLYSANPYFEVLRTDPLPSLSQFDFGCAIYDLDGNSLFNPRRLTSGLSPGDLERLHETGEAFWSVFRERGTVHDVYLFRSKDRFYSLFAPRRTLKTRAVDFLRFFFSYLTAALLVLLPVTLASGRHSLGKPLRSFSNRVYAAFLAVALIPLLLYTVFTQNLFDGLFTQRFLKDSAAHAATAKGLMEAFLIIQGVEASPYLAPSEDLALWISSTLSSDVILYGDAVLLASSRREFFDSGLLPDILDGEAYHALVYGRQPFFTKRTMLGGYSFQTLTVPYAFQNTQLFISLPFPLEKEEMAEATREIIEFLVLLSAFFFAMIAVFARGIRSMIIVPVRKLLAGTKEVGLGNLEVTIEHRSRDEMMTLIDGFNQMIRNLKAHEQELAEMSKKVAWTEMARKVAHEIKNPLTPIQLSAEHVLKVYEDKRGDLDKALRESMSYIISEVDNLRRIAQEFMEISRDTTIRKDPLDLRAVLEETLEPYRRLLAERIRFKIVYEGRRFRGVGDAAKLKTALRNIVANAVEAISRQGEISVTAVEGDRTATISVRDTGAGMSRETAERIFDLYFSTKGGGTGLGLPIARKIIEEHGGTVRVASAPGQGTTVTLELPLGGT
ncbi:MAG: HAMP domain-containing sensor histidine kinase [Candidatus Aminicenantes bacterium]